MPLDVAEDVLCGGQRFRRGGAGIHPHGLQAGKDLSGGKGLHPPTVPVATARQADPFWGRCCKKPCRAFQQGQRHRLQSAGLGRCFLGAAQCSARSTGGHRWASGHFSHRGAPFGTQTSAPSSIRGLIVVAGRIRRLVFHHAGGERFFHGRFRDGTGVVVQTGKHPQHIAVHRGYRDAKADGRNGPRCSPRCRAAPAGHRSRRAAGRRTARRRCLRPSAGCAPGCSSQDPPTACAAFPLRRRQGRISGSAAKAFVIGQCRRDPGLLQHDLAEPHIGRGWGRCGRAGCGGFCKTSPAGQRKCFPLVFVLLVEKSDILPI